MQPVTQTGPLARAIAQQLAEWLELSYPERLASLRVLDATTLVDPRNAAERQNDEDAADW